MESELNWARPIRKSALTAATIWTIEVSPIVRSLLKTSIGSPRAEEIPRFTEADQPTLEGFLTITHVGRLTAYAVKIDRLESVDPSSTRITSTSSDETSAIALSILSSSLGSHRSPLRLVIMQEIITKFLNKACRRPDYKEPHWFLHKSIGFQRRLVVIASEMTSLTSKRNS